MNSPYENLPSRAFWRTGVGTRAPLDPGDLYAPKFRIHRQMRIMTAGSCFAQHVGKALRRANLPVIDTESLPEALAGPRQEKYGYNLYSARYGNIYTARQLRQLIEEAYGRFTPAEPVWEKNGSYYDSLRPSVEPDGLNTPEDVSRHREIHLASVRRAINQADVFVFTFGLTEAWIHTESGTVYPTAPGTIAGRYCPDTYVFKNFNAFEVYEDFKVVMDLLKARSKKCRFLVTVSPVPLTATASGEHVEVATTYSKAVLRSVCGMLVQEFPDVDYFPSFELITSTNNRGIYFDQNKRSVLPEGVNAAMSLFLSAHGLSTDPTTEAANPRPSEEAEEATPQSSDETDVQCEDALLEAFAK